MELKSVNPIGDNVVANDLINVNFFVFKNCEIEFKTNIMCYFF
jgi:hypothetical protein